MCDLENNKTPMQEEEKEKIQAILIDIASQVADNNCVPKNWFEEISEAIREI